MSAAGFGAGMSDGAAAAATTSLDQLRRDVLEDLEERKGSRALAWGDELEARCREIAEELERDNAEIDRGIQNVSRQHLDAGEETFKYLKSFEGSSGQELKKLLGTIADRLRGEEEDIPDFQQLNVVHGTLLNVIRVEKIGAALLNLDKLRASAREVFDAAHDEEGQVTDLEEVYWDLRVRDTEYDMFDFVNEVRSGQHDFQSHLNDIEKVLEPIVGTLRTTFLNLMPQSYELYACTHFRQMSNEKVRDRANAWVGARLLEAVAVVKAESERFDSGAPGIGSLYSSNSFIFSGGDGSEMFSVQEQAAVQGQGFHGLMLHWVRQSVRDLWATMLDIPKDGSGSSREYGALQMGKQYGTGAGGIKLADLAKDGGYLSTWIRTFVCFTHYFVRESVDPQTLRTRDDMWEEIVWGRRKTALQVVNVAVSEVHRCVQAMLGACTMFLSNSERSSIEEEVPHIQKLAAWIPQYINLLQLHVGSESAFDWDRMDTGDDPLLDFPGPLRDQAQQDLEKTRQELIQKVNVLLRGFLVGEARRRAVELAQTAADPDAAGSRGPFDKEGSLEGKLVTFGPPDLFYNFGDQAGRLLGKKGQNTGEAVANFASSVAEACSKYCSTFLQMLQQIRDRGDIDTETHLLWLCAFMNDTSRCGALLDELFSSYLSAHSESEQGLKAKREAQSHFENSASLAAESLAKIVLQLGEVEERLKGGATFQSVFTYAESGVLARSEEEAACSSFLDTSPLRRVIGAVVHEMGAAFVKHILSAKEQPEGIGTDARALDLRYKAMKRDLPEPRGRDGTKAGAWADRKAEQCHCALQHLDRLFLVKEFAVFKAHARKAQGDHADLSKQLVLDIIRKRGKSLSGKGRSPEKSLEDFPPPRPLAEPSIFARPQEPGAAVAAVVVEEEPEEEEHPLSMSPPGPAASAGGMPEDDGVLEQNLNAFLSD
eukprot:Hpha_TRINITY_DN17383_c0_g1::TRINITY_DN17383_c0_g1_i1::g.137945::m.137945